MEGSTIAAWVTGIGAVLSAGAGVAMIWREVKSRQHKEIRRLDEELSTTQEQVVASHRYIFELRSALAEQGIDVPPPPSSSSDEPE